MRADLVARGASFRELWPGLQLISCWASAAAAPRAARLAELFPGTLVQPKGLLATEAPMTMPWIPSGGAVPLVTEVLLELEDEHGEVRRVDELPRSAEGREYRVVVSQTAGLVRYRIGDRVVVTGRHRGVPCLEFGGREGDVSDLVGEKLSERFVRDVLAELPLPRGTFRVLVPRDGSVPRYVLVVDAHPTTSTIPPEVAGALDALLQRAHHYRIARLLGQLAPPEILPVSHAEERVRDVFVARGMKLGDIKDRSLLTGPADAAQVLAALTAPAETAAQTSGA